ncbi:MAG: leucyl aminopeptidase [Actinobacteria bacterium]|nr:leucyl aminopeptidase [Actinomycetota bacterium]
MLIHHSFKASKSSAALRLRPIESQSEIQFPSDIAEFALPTEVPDTYLCPAIPDDDAEATLAWARRFGEYAAAAGRLSGRPLTLDLEHRTISARQLSSLLAGILDGGKGSADSPGITLVCGLEDDTDFARVLEEQEPLHRATALAAQLTDARANQLTPTDFAKHAEQIAAELGLGFRATGAAELRAQGYGGITAIGQGSDQPPVLVELWYSGSSEPGEEPPTGAVALAGKGVTFDSGGLSIKPAAGMYSMHTDCAGAATALAALRAFAELGGETPVHIALPLVENLPGPHSVRPGDVVRMRNGSGLEIVDTDFEGRVILADAVSRLAEHEPRAILSLATLTYQIVVALGPDIAGLFSRDETLAARAAEAADRAGEALWRMPWATRYASQLRSSAPGADLRNHPLHDSGRAITAALFLGEFAPASVPFAHIDFAGPAVRTTANGPVATGYGVRTLVEMLLHW